jgi:hypothetical protein
MELTELQPAYLRPRLGDESQFAHVREVRLQDGAEDGVRALDVRVAGGLHVLVLCDRGLDLGPAWYRGVPLHWASPTGVVHPAFTQDHAWLRSFHGGLMVTAGLQNVGPASGDDGERNVAWRIEHDGPVPRVEISGEVRETTVYGADLRLRRRLVLAVGSPVLEVHDEVCNAGFSDEPLMLLYHVNVGHPAVTEGATVVGPDADVLPFDGLAAADLGRHHEIHAPQAGAAAQVYEHRLRGPADRWVTIAVVNPDYRPTDGVGVAVSYRPDQLPRLWHWRMLAPGLYLTGLEPANCGIRGHAVERADALVDTLAAGESRHFDLRLTAAHGREAVHAMTQEAQQ